MTHTIPLPPLPDMTALATSRHPALAQVAADLTGRPASCAAFYEDSPYVALTVCGEVQR
jgi:hypothetical protein